MDSYYGNMKGVEGRQRQHAIGCFAVEKAKKKWIMKTAFKVRHNLKAFVHISLRKWPGAGTTFILSVWIRASTCQDKDVIKVDS